MKLADILANNTRKALGAFTSSPLALQIHVIRLGLEVAADFGRLAERGVVALEGIARATGAKLPAPDDQAASEAQARAARRAALKRELEQLDLDGDGKPDGSPAAPQDD